MRTDSVRRKSWKTYRDDVGFSTHNKDHPANISLLRSARDAVRPKVDLRPGCLGWREQRRSPGVVDDVEHHKALESVAYAREVD